MQAFEEAANLSQQSSVSMWSLMDDDPSRPLKRSRSLRYTHYDNMYACMHVSMYVYIYVCMYVHMYDNMYICKRVDI